MNKFKELFEARLKMAAKSKSKSERLADKKANPFICTDELKALFKNKVEFTIEMANGEIIQFSQAGNRKWWGKNLTNHRGLTHSDNTARTANEHLQHMADLGIITGACKILKVDGKSI